MHRQSTDDAAHAGVADQWCCYSLSMPACLRAVESSESYIDAIRFKGDGKSLAHPRARGSEPWEHTEERAAVLLHPCIQWLAQAAALTECKSDEIAKRQS